MEKNMKGLLRRIAGVIARVLPPDGEPASSRRGGADWLPPVLGPADWSYGFIASMADSSNAWYFDRR